MLLLGIEIKKAGVSLHELNLRRTYLSRLYTGHNTLSLLTVFNLHKPIKILCWLIIHIELISLICHSFT